jgi:thiol-disulfide isomerase/thioredoxin
MVLVESERLSQGWEAVDFKLEGVDGKEYSLDSFSDKKGLLIIFTCNHCPYAKAAWPITIGLANQYEEGVSFVAVNPNSANKEYPDDSLEEMKKKATEWEIPFPYLADDTQSVARDYKAQCTPDLYLFKNEEGKFKLFYHGRVADEWEKPALTKERNLEGAIQKLVAGEAPPEDQPSSMGCSIKWSD